MRKVLARMPCPYEEGAQEGAPVEPLAELLLLAARDEARAERLHLAPLLVEMLQHEQLVLPPLALALDEAPVDANHLQREVEHQEEGDDRAREHQQRDQARLQRALQPAVGGVRRLLLDQVVGEPDEEEEVVHLGSTA